MDMKIKEEFLETEDSFRTNALNIITAMLKLNTSRPTQTTVLVDEILHSIFFLGKIKQPSYTPESIVSNSVMLAELKDIFPRPFDNYSSQLPQRTPFSCVLDMIVNLIGEENETQIKERLQEFVNERTGKERLVSSTICVSQDTRHPNSTRYYGVSMSTSGRNPGQIMVAASCLKTWDSCVAAAVMTYCPSKVKNFDGTMQLPKYVRCMAFTLSSGSELPPCKSCATLFGLETQVTQKWPYGNCAETESLSNLLKQEGEIKMEAQASTSYTEQHKMQAKENVAKHLTTLLGEVKFGWNSTFYKSDPVVRKCD